MYWVGLRIYLILQWTYQTTFVAPILAHFASWIFANDVVTATWSVHSWSTYSRMRLNRVDAVVISGLTLDDIMRFVPVHTKRVTPWIDALTTMSEMRPWCDCAWDAVLVAYKSRQYWRLQWKRRMRKTDCKVCVPRLLCKVQIMEYICHYVG